jgi:hydroxymethylbilane synthase
MPIRTVLRLGTRGSLLALAQSRIVARALSAVDPRLRIELITLETRGDRDRDTPLSSVRDPGFFSAEIDESLRSGAVDFCAHSLKDLPVTAREGVRTAAIPVRDDPRDVVVFRSWVSDRVRAGTPLRIGSSSHRRAEMAIDFLAEALPAGAHPPRLWPLPLRGTVEQRLRRVRLPESDPQALDGVVLALAGIARLWRDPDGHCAIAPLLQDTRLMVLPLSLCPTAPGQGALAVDCRSNDARVATLLAAIHDSPTARSVRGELALLAAQPEEERGHFGATAIRHDICGMLTFVRGRSDGRDFKRVVWSRPRRPTMARAWDGAQWMRASAYQPLPLHAGLGTPRAVFLAHWRALPPDLRLPVGVRIWVSGVESWRRLARRGVWVEGCADDLGFDALAGTLRSPVLRLPPLAEWTVLTHQDAVPSWRGSGVGRVIPTYAVTAPAEAPLHAIRRDVADATHFFWRSGAQYRALRDWLPADAHHACGPGKTFRALRADGAGNLRAFPSRHEWQTWVA